MHTYAYFLIGTSIHDTNKMLQFLMYFDFSDICHCSVAHKQGNPKQEFF